jgi:hypothetical protein
VALRLSFCGGLFGFELLAAFDGAMGVQDGVRDVGEDAGLAFGNGALGKRKEDVIENAGDVFGRGEVVGQTSQVAGELFGAAGSGRRKVFLAERFLRRDGEITAGATAAGNMLATGPYCGCCG